MTPRARPRVVAPAWLWLDYNGRVEVTRKETAMNLSLPCTAVPSVAGRARGACAAWWLA